MRQLDFGPMIALSIVLPLLFSLGGESSAEEKRADIAAGSASYQGAPGGVTHQVAALDAPTVAGPAYGLRGRVRAEGVEGAAHLEMWSVFGPGARFFTRTTGSEGALAILSGDQAWRNFELPFFPEEQAPQRIELNLVFSGAGHVWFDSLELVQYASKAEASAVFGDLDRSANGAAPLWLIGGVGIGAVAALLAVTLRRRAARAELRRMAALDAGGGIS